MRILATLSALSLLSACSGGGTSAPPARSHVAETEAPPAPLHAPPAPNIVYGEIHMLESVSGDDEEDGPLLLMSEIESEPMPRTDPIGHVHVHAGFWEMRLIRDVTSEFTTVSVVDRRGVCEAQVVGARHLHAFHPSEFNDSGSDGERTFLALEIQGCQVGILGVAGTSIEVHSLRREDMTETAPPALVALVREPDDELGWSDPLAADAFRVLPLPDLGLTIVAGTGAWVVRNGAVLHERFGGLPELVVVAGPHVLFSMTTPNEGWLASIDDFRPGTRQ